MSLSNEQIVDAIATKSLMDVMELVKAIDEKFGVSAAAPVAAESFAPVRQALAANHAAQQSLNRARRSLDEDLFAA